MMNIIGTFIIMSVILSIILFMVYIRANREIKAQKSEDNSIQEIMKDENKTIEKIVDNEIVYNKKYSFEISEKEFNSTGQLTLGEIVEKFGGQRLREEDNVIIQEVTKTNHEATPQIAYRYIVECARECSEIQTSMSPIEDYQLEDSFKEILEKAEMGDMISQRKIAEVYAAGEGVRKDYYRAMKWYKEAAKQGDTISQNKVADYYDKCIGLDVDIAEAKVSEYEDWILKRAEEGDVYAQNTLAGKYYWNAINDCDDSLYYPAMELYRGAANMGLVRAQQMLAQIYRIGYWKDATIAQAWEDKANKAERIGRWK